MFRCRASLLRTSLSYRIPHNLSWTTTLTRKYAKEATPSASHLRRVNVSLEDATALFKTYKPVSPGLRHLRRPRNAHLYEGPPVRDLTVARRKKGGRNNQGRITVRHIGGGHKQRIRIIDFDRKIPGDHDVIRIEYDPGRSAHIALLKSRDKNAGREKFSYILAPEGLKAGDTVRSFRMGIPANIAQEYTLQGDRLKDSKKTSESDTGVSNDMSLAMSIVRSYTIRTGNVLPLKSIPPGTYIHNITLKPDGRGILVRSAGSFGTVVAHTPGDKYVQVQLQSGEIRKVLQDCCATVGAVSNPLWKDRSLGKAGRSRWLGHRPKVRGVAMNKYASSIFDSSLRLADHNKSQGRPSSWRWTW